MTITIIIKLLLQSLFWEQNCCNSISIGAECASEVIRKYPCPKIHVDKTWKIIVTCSQWKAPIDFTFAEVLCCWRTMRTEITDGLVPGYQAWVKRKNRIRYKLQIFSGLVSTHKLRKQQRCLNGWTKTSYMYLVHNIREKSSSPPPPSVCPSQTTLQLRVFKDFSYWPEIWWYDECSMKLIIIWNNHVQPMFAFSDLGPPTVLSVFELFVIININQDIIRGIAIIMKWQQVTYNHPCVFGIR